MAFGNMKVSSKVNSGVGEFDPKMVIATLEKTWIAMRITTHFLVHRGIQNGGTVFEFDW